MASHLQSDVSRTFWFSEDWKAYRDSTLRSDLPFGTPESFLRGMVGKVPPIPNIVFPFTSSPQLEDISREDGDHYYFRGGSSLEDELCRRIVQAEAGHVFSSFDYLSAAVFSSGMAAISSLVLTFANAFSKRDTSDLHFVVDKHVYADTAVLFDQYVPSLGFGKTIFADCADEDNIRLILSYHPDKILAIFYEPFSLPNLKYVDTGNMRKIADDYGGIPLIADTTLIPPNLQQQFRLGIDVVVSSLSKYISGEGDITGGMLVAPQKMIAHLRRLQHRVFGNLPSLQAMSDFCERYTTLPQRMRAHIANANVFSEYLRAHPNVERVYFPSAKGIVEGGSPGAVFSFSLAGNTDQEKKEKATKLMQYLIDHHHTPIANQVSFGSGDHAMIVHIPYHRIPGVSGLVRFAVGRGQPAGMVLQCLDDGLAYANRK